MDEDEPTPEPPPTRGPSTLWTIAIALIVVSVLVSLLTPYKLFILFIPIGLAPLFIRWRRR